VVVLISVVYYSEWRTDGCEVGGGERRGGVRGCRWRSAVARAGGKEGRETETDGGRERERERCGEREAAEGDQKSGREEAKETTTAAMTTTTRKEAAGCGGRLPPLNPLVLALNMIQMLSSLPSRLPGARPNGGTRTTSDHPDPLCSLLSAQSFAFLSPFLSSPCSSLSPSLRPPFSLSCFVSLAALASSADLFPRLTPGIARG